MKILAIDTATEACSAALYIGEDSGGYEVTADYRIAPREHTRLILKMIDKLLADAEIPVSKLDAIAFGRGPGSFMGLRIAAGVAQGIAFAHDIPVIAVSTLQAIAQRAFEETQCKRVLVAIDARMDEVYWAACFLQDGQWLLDGDEQVISPDNIHLPQCLQQQDKSWVAAGTGWGSYTDRLLSGSEFTPQVVLPECFPRAEDMVKMAARAFRAGETITAAEAIPVYLRNDVAKKPKPFVL